MSKKVLSIITYNILADYLKNEGYIFSKKEYLNNNYRINLLIKKIKKEINRNKNSIFCFQEVGPDQYAYLHILFSNNEYNSVIFRDNAIFYPSSYKVTFVETQTIRKLSDKYLKDKPKLIKQTHNFNHSYIILTLKSKYFKEITVCCTHLISNPKHENIKILQCYLLAKHLESFKRVIFCGDFNSMPYSKQYELLSIGKTKYPYYKELKTKLKITSAYKKFYGEEINITTHTSNMKTPVFTETIDYIWITKEFIPINTTDVITRADIIKKQEKYKKDTLPNKKEPSDHYMLRVDLQLKN